MTTSAVAGTPGVAATGTDVAAMRTVARELAAIANVTAVALHVADDAATALLRASGPVDRLLEVVADHADHSLYTCHTRTLLRHRVRWDPMAPTPGVSAVYRICRHPDLDPAGFHRHWEHTHGPLALRHHLGMWDYAQLSVVATHRGPEIDGIAVVQWPTLEDWRTRFFDDDRGAELIIADAGAFTDPSRSQRALTTEHVAVAEPVPAAGPVALTDHRQLELPVGPERLWAVVSDFGALLDWWPSGLASVAGGPEPGVRTITRTDGSVVVERLTRQRDDERMLELEVTEGLPASISHYTCRYEVRAVDGGCRLDWQPRAVAEGEGCARFGRMIDGGWRQISAGLTRALAR